MQITSSIIISKVILTLFILSTILLLGNITLAQSTEKTIAGNWLGTLEINTIKLRLGLKIVAKDDGSFTATFDSIDQGAKDLPIDKITYQEGAVNFEAKQFDIIFNGKLENGDIVGEFKQGQGKFPLTFKRQDAPVTLNRPQHPNKPYPYEEQEVSYENKKDGIKLAGTLSLPKASKAPFAAVILITGSGPQNRDEEIFGHKPFLVLADYLTRQGIAVLRLDDRGVGGSSKNVPTETSENYAEDVLAGVEFLKSNKSINPKQIGLIGHSEGGLIAPMVATKSTDIAFIVSLAGPGLTGSEIIKLQGALIAKASGASDQAIASSRELQEISFQILKTEKDNVIAKKRIVEESKKFYAKFSKEEKQALGIPADITDEQIESSLGRFVSSWFRFFLEYDPRPTLKNVKCPVLAVNGEKDLQVPYQENLSEIEKALKASGNKDFQIKSFPDLNHLFQTSKTGSPSEYGSIEETFAPVVLKEVGDWILARVTVNK